MLSMMIGWRGRRFLSSGLRGEMMREEYAEKKLQFLVDCGYIYWYNKIENPLLQRKDTI